MPKKTTAAAATELTLLTTFLFAACVLRNVFLCDTTAVEWSQSWEKSLILLRVLFEISGEISFFTFQSSSSSSTSSSLLLRPLVSPLAGLLLLAQFSFGPSELRLFAHRIHSNHLCRRSRCRAAETHDRHHTRERGRT